MNTEFKKELDSIYFNKKQTFGRGNYYQSSELLNISGQRPTAFRFKTYHLEEYLSNNDSVLDIGCNSGFFSLHLSEYVNEIEGFDNNPTLIAVANKARDFLKKDNANFFVDNFSSFTPSKKYDVVMSFAIHLWIKMPFKEYANKIMSMVKNNGTIIIESHDYLTEDSDWKEKMDIFIKEGFTEVYSDEIKDDKKVHRIFSILKR